MGVVKLPRGYPREKGEPNFGKSRGIPFDKQNIVWGKPHRDDNSSKKDMGEISPTTPTKHQLITQINSRKKVRGF